MNDNSQHDPAAGTTAGSSASPDGSHLPRAATQQATDKAQVEGEALRRRQLLAALCHGTDRSWRDRYRAWPAFVVGLVIAAVICAGFGVAGAFHKQQRLDQQKEREQQHHAMVAGYEVPFTPV